MTVATPIPTVTGCEMREIDQIVTGEYGSDLVRMMENAGRALAQVAVSAVDQARAERARPAILNPV
jgi:NAD(P)H-hydrate repair Nnr-like enzyme with NAD(P)H-hydrate epimerase domain